MSYLEEKPCVSGGLRQTYEEAFVSFALGHFPGSGGEEALPFIVRSKIHHTLDVCRIGEYIMEKEPCWKALPRREHFLGYCVCLAHDLSRFSQYRDFGTLRDDVSFDHGEKSAFLLRSGAFPLPELAPEEREKVARAVEVHNKKRIPETYPADELHLAKLVRDADKLSILKVVTGHFETPEEKRDRSVELGVPDTPGCTEEVLEKALAGNGISYRDIRNVNDFKIVVFQWPEDLNYSASAQYALEKDLFGKFASFLPSHPKMPLLVERTLSLLRSLAAGERGLCGAS